MPSRLTATLPRTTATKTKVPSEGGYSTKGTAIQLRGGVGRAGFKDMMKNIDTLVPDILRLFDEGHIPALGDPNFGDIVGRRLREQLDDNPRNTLRMSSLGKRDKQLWFGVNRPDLQEKLSSHARIKFLYGDLLEAMLLRLAEEAGHRVERQQGEVRLEGIVGHIDAVIDGVLVDVKSANSRAFDTFSKGLEAVRQDVFLGSYLYQLAAYSRALGGLDGGFLVIDKLLGKITLLRVPVKVLEEYEIEKRIIYLKDMVAKAEPPDTPCPDTEFGKSGNRVLSAPCTYCAYKHECCRAANNGAGLRTFLYAKGPVHFTHIEKLPDVFEITDKKDNNNAED